MFSAQEQQQLPSKQRHLIKLYNEVKPYIVASEKEASRLGGNGGQAEQTTGIFAERLSIVAINELRNAFDHEMRAQAVWQGCNPVPVASDLSAYDYCLTNLGKAVAHVYRAGYDALDIATSAEIEGIRRITESIRPTTLVAVMVDYAQVIRQPIEQAIDLCNKAKASKDVESENAERQSYETYKTSLEMLRIVKAKLDGRLPELQAVEAEKAREASQQYYHAIRQRNHALILAAIGVLVSLVFGVITILK